VESARRQASSFKLVTHRGDVVLIVPGCEGDSAAAGVRLCTVFIRFLASARLVGVKNRSIIYVSRLGRNRRMMRPLRASGALYHSIGGPASEHSAQPRLSTRALNYSTIFRLAPTRYRPR